jgi:glycosyltransferase involved in cell wall biosynthesis
MVKLIIQIPCFNEAQTLPTTLEEIPLKFNGVDIVEILVIDDGSVDGTAEVAKKNGVDHIVRLERNRGLGQAFQTGLRRALELDADIIVNTDADNQYCAKDIQKLIDPILSGKADFVVGCRPIFSHPEFHFIKKGLQWLGSYILRLMSKTDVPDAASGFRAYSSETCMKLNVYSDFSHCMETLIQAGNAGMSVIWTNININPSTRSSRLFKSIPQYILQSGRTILVMSSMYSPGRFFSLLSSFFLLPALMLGVRFIYLTYYVPSDLEKTYLPSLILLSVLGLTGIILLTLATLGELFRTHRKLNESILYETKMLSLSQRKLNQKESNFS